VSDRPTPETDAETAHKQDAYEFVNPPEWEWVVTSDFARNLERQRDEASDLARELRDMLVKWHEAEYLFGPQVTENEVKQLLLKVNEKLI